MRNRRKVCCLLGSFLSVLSAADLPLRFCHHVGRGGIPEIELWALIKINATPENEVQQTMCSI